jgi:hypothetical protein
MLTVNDINTINKNADTFLGNGAGTFVTSALDKPISWWLDIIAKEKRSKFEPMTEMEILRQIVFEKA